MKPVHQSKAVVLGSGKAGISMMRFLLDQGARVSVSDNGELGLEQDQISILQNLGVKFEAGGHSEGFVTDADFVAISPGIPLDAPVVEMIRRFNIPIMGELGLFSAEKTFPVAAVTGSNGKTTVTALLGTLMQQAYNEVFIGGNIGTPLLTALTGSKPIEWAVFELSSFQLELVDTFQPDISLILNVSPDHLDRHHCMKEYIKAKLNICRNQKTGDKVVLGGDDPLLEQIAVEDGVEVYRFGTASSNDSVVMGNVIELNYSCNEVVVCEQYDLINTQMTSHVNKLNCAAAILAARLAGCSFENIVNGLALFQPPEHRMTPVGVIDGVTYINDSKATNIGAMHAALNGFPSPVVLIAGGRNKGSDFNVVSSTVAEKVRCLILIGEAAGAMEEALSGVVQIEHATSMEEAVMKAHEISCSGETVLLAPGCASFDMFSGYEERGQIFTEVVSRLNSSTELQEV